MLYGFDTSCRSYCAENPARRKANGKIEMASLVAHKTGSAVSVCFGLDAPTTMLVGAVDGTDAGIVEGAEVGRELDCACADNAQNNKGKRARAVMECRSFE
jgi:hypothetical protein